MAPMLQLLQVLQTEKASCLLTSLILGGAFGGGAVIMSIIAFVIACKEYAPVVSVLLFVNGGLIIAGMIALLAQGALSSVDSSKHITYSWLYNRNGGYTHRTRGRKLIRDKKGLATREGKSLLRSEKVCRS